MPRPTKCACCGVSALKLRPPPWAEELLCILCFVWAARQLSFDPFLWAVA